MFPLVHFKFPHSDPKFKHFLKKKKLVLYQHYIVNDDSGTLKDVLDDDEKRFNIKLFIIMDMGCINLVQDLMVGQGKQAQATLIGLL